MTMLAVLERLDRLTNDAPPPGAATADIVAFEQRVAANREARARAERLSRSSAARSRAFSATDTTAVMAALHAIHWVKAVHRIVRHGFGDARNGHPAADHPPRRCAALGT